MKVPDKVRAKVLERSEIDGYPMCEAMIHLPKTFGMTRDLCLRRGTNVHHRINRSVGGGYELSSLLVLCGSGTTGCHGWVTHNPLLARDFGWALRSTDDPRTRRVYYRGRWAILTDDGGVYFNSELNPLGDNEL